ncbi:hypothetical protein D3C75_1056780 [compost metagenome]
MYRRSSGLHAHTEPGALADQLRLIQRHLGQSRRRNAVACSLDHFQRLGELVVFPLGMGEILHQLQEMILAADFHTHHFLQNVVIQLIRGEQIDFGHTLAHIHIRQGGALDKVITAELANHPVHITEPADVLHSIPHRGFEFRTQPVLLI